MESSFALEKIEGAMESLQRAKDDYKNGNKLAAKGDLDFAIDKSREAIFIMLAEIEEENDGKIYK